MLARIKRNKKEASDRGKGSESAVKFQVQINESKALTPRLKEIIDTFLPSLSDQPFFYSFDSC